ncbi:MAG: hypothetical protein DMF23_12655 [Verrucomicrobia bacterium]|nr:MAG: hypothetical protein DMF23_12655 [Verrucomicrobiota bacterium]
MLILASRQNNLSGSSKLESKVRAGGTPSPTRGTRALPDQFALSRKEVSASSRNQPAGSLRSPDQKISIRE